jgi:hypothetical protein
MRRGKFFARPVSGPGQPVQVMKAKTGVRGQGHAFRTRNQPPCKRPDCVIRDLKTRDFSEGISHGPKYQCRTAYPKMRKAVRCQTPDGPLCC